MPELRSRLDFGKRRGPVPDLQLDGNTTCVHGHHSALEPALVLPAAAEAGRDPDGLAHLFGPESPGKNFNFLVKVDNFSEKSLPSRDTSLKSRAILGSCQQVGRAEKSL